MALGDSMISRHIPAPEEKCSSPLHFFGQAKKQINDIFVDIQDFVANASEHMTNVNIECPDVINEKELKSILDYRSKVKGICEVLTRDYMKVAFFGRTRNGKSTVVNAMLGEKVLPSGIGHTTNCVLQVKGSQTGDAYLVTDGGKVKQYIESVSHLVQSLNCKNKLYNYEFVHLYWPKDKCSLLRDDVALVDSPGVDVTPHLNDLVDAHCIDADIFVLVANAESPLTITEKNFFHKVSTKLSNPNIFILNNRCDVYANEPELLDQVRKQHMKCATDFLVKELEIYTAEEAASRVFFISAKEVLQARVQERKGLAPRSGTLSKGFAARYMEFKVFERKLKECISKYVFKTKFLNHSQQGKHLINEMCKVMEITCKRSLEQTNLKEAQKKEFQEKLNFTNQQVINLTNLLKIKIHSVIDDVEDKVSKALNDEIRRLYVLVDEFNSPFHSDPLVLNAYKRELNDHVVAGLVSNLRARLSTDLAMTMEQSQNDMVTKMSELLPENRRNISLSNSKCKPFEVLYRLHCDNLCSDFCEQLQFKFSWDLSKIYYRVSSLIAQTQSRILMSPSQNQSTSDWLGGSFNNNRLIIEQYLSSMSRFLIGSQDVIIGGFFLTGITIIKAVGWRVLGISLSVYSCLFAYEWLSWTTKAKEREFKEQYVDYATNKLRMMIDITSANYSHQVQRELTSTCAQLCQLVDESAANLNDKLKNLEDELKILAKSTDVSKTLRKKADLLKVDLKQFDNIFLSQN